MILGSESSRLSKWHGVTSVAACHELGCIAVAMVNLLALCPVV
jgi:hypothetical protein